MARDSAKNAEPLQLHWVSVYNRPVTIASDRAILRGRLYEAYASQHAGKGDGSATALAYRRDIRPLLPMPSTGKIVDIGCGQGEMVRLLLADGYDAAGIDVSPEQVAIAHKAGLDQVHYGDYYDMLIDCKQQLAAVTATDLLEHLTKNEVLETFDHVARSLRADGVFIARVPNAVSPFGGHISYGDFTHESFFTASSIRQLAAAVGLTHVAFRPCTPVAHGLVSSARAVVWKSVSGLYKTALAAETGVLRGHIVTQNLTFVARKETGRSEHLRHP